MSSRVIAVMLALGLFFVAPVQAEESDHTMWLHHNDGNLFLSDVKADPANDGGRLYRNFIGVGMTDYVDTASGIASADVPFRAGEDIQVTVFVGDYGGWFATWGTLDIAIDLSIGGSTVSGASQTVTYTPGVSSQFHAVTWNLAAPVEGIVAGDAVSLVIRQSGEASGYVIGTNDNYGHSHIVFPGQQVLPVELPDVVMEDLEVPIVEHTFENATTALYQFNFTSQTGFGLLDVDVNGTGVANATLVDGNGTEVFNGTLATDLIETQNFTAGNWTLHLAYTDFNGSMRFEFLDGQAIPENVEDAATGADADTGATDGNETVDAVDAGSDDQEAPGAPLVALLAGLVAIAIRRRK